MSQSLSLSSAVLAASVGAAVLYATLVRSRPSVWRMTIKTCSTALLAAVVMVEGGPLRLAGALALGSLGDAFLAWDDETSFFRGLASFLAAHLLYIAVFTHGKTEVHIFWALLTSSGWRAAAAGSLALLVPTMVALLLPRLGQALRAPVVVYSLTIFVMAFSALTLDSPHVVARALMFTASDSILAADRFLVAPTSPHKPWMQHAVWVLYYAGQFLIAMGFLALQTSGL